MLSRLLKLITLVGVLVVISTPAFAIANPDSIAFGTGTSSTYNVFENVLEDGDMLIAAEGYVHYIVEPTDYQASESFLFELLQTDNTTIVSVPLNQYEDRPISIYLSDNRVTTLGLVSGTAYTIRITGNPLIFPSPVGNTVNATLAASDYIDQELGVDSDPPNDNLLRNFMIQMATHIEDNDTPTDPYLASVQGYQFLTLDGANIFIEGIPSLIDMCPVLFQAGTETMTSEPPETTGAYALTLTPAQKWGTTAANGLTNLGVFLGVNQALAGSMMLVVLSIAFAVAAYAMTSSGVFVVLLMASTPFIGAWLGLMPLALAFILVIIVVALLGYFFFSRGAL
jgi:hypothetical protein